MDKNELQQLWSKKARDDKSPHQMQASVLMGRSLGVFVDRAESLNIGLELDLGSMTTQQLKHRVMTLLREMEQSHEGVGVDELGVEE